MVVYQWNEYCVYFHVNFPISQGRYLRAYPDAYDGGLWIRHRIRSFTFTWSTTLMVECTRDFDMALAYGAFVLFGRKLLNIAL